MLEDDRLVQNLRSLYKNEELEYFKRGDPKQFYKNQSQMHIADLHIADFTDQYQSFVYDPNPKEKEEQYITNEQQLNSNIDQLLNQ